MDVLQRLTEAGFARVLVLDGGTCGAGAPTLLLAMMFYEPEQYADSAGALIHPYYFASQRAYRAASALVQEARPEGIGLCLRDELRVKPIFARLPELTQGRNTLSFTREHGSRFHVQILTLDEPLTPNASLLAEPKPTHCGSCTRCMAACPTHAIDETGFHRERCLRNWQLSGKPVPPDLRPLMGQRLIGCDECQRCCPHNPPTALQPRGAVPLKQLLTAPKDASATLREQIGANLALPNRVLAQSLLCAGCSGDRSLLPLTESLARHPSPAVSEHALWAADELRKQEADPC